MARNNLSARARVAYDKYVGNYYINNDGDRFKVLDYIDRNNSTILFDDGTIKEHVRITLVTTGQIRNPNFKNKNKIFGKFISGVGKYSKSNTPLIYKCWYNILSRCYDINIHSKQPTYIGCSIDERWWNLQEFGKWYDENYVEGFAIDKDILHKGNKIYGPDTCCFVPQEINNLFTKSNMARGNLPIGVNLKKASGKYGSQLQLNGTIKFLGYHDTIEEAFQKYKEAKELHIKELANKWKDKISEKVYKALMNYKVEITD